MKIKRLFLTLIVLFSCCVSFSQVRIDNSVPYFDVQFKRAVVKGSSLYLDLQFINTSQLDTYLQVTPGYIIDDEGNRYKAWYTEDNKGSMYQITIPSETTQKLRFIIKNLDEYANSFQIIDFECYVSNKRDPDWHGGASGKLRLRDVPIHRETE